MSDSELDALIRGAAVLVHPSLYEGYGLVLVEAMARDVPVVVANATALPETAGDAAVLFDPLTRRARGRDPSSALAERDELIEKGRARIAELSWDRAARETVAAYEDALR